MNPAEFAHIAAAEDTFWWYRGMRRILFDLLDPLAKNRPLNRVLEGGCGTGDLARRLQERYGWEVTGMDLDARGLAFARQAGLTNLVQGSIAALPFESGSFDCTLSMDVVVHLPEGEETGALREFGRVTRKGGLLILRVSALRFLRSRHSEYVGERQRFTRSRLLAAARGSGWTVRRCTYLNSVLLPVAWFKFRVWEELTRAKPDSGVHSAPPWLDRMLYAPLACESRWLSAGLNLPAGQSLLLIAENDSN